MWDEVFGNVGGGEAWSGGFDAADIGALDVEAVAEEAEHLFDVLLKGANDVFFEEGLPAADGLGFVKEMADFVDEGALAAKVDGALPAVLAPSEAVVGAEAATAVGAPGGDDGALAGEAGGIVAEESKGFVVFLACIHAYSIVI